VRAGNLFEKSSERRRRDTIFPPISNFACDFRPRSTAAPNPSLRPNCLEPFFALTLPMNFALNPPRAVARIHGTVVARGRSFNPLVRLTFPPPPSSKSRFTWTNLSEKKSPSFSYSCKRLFTPSDLSEGQPLSFDTHTNSPGVAYSLSLPSPPVGARYIVPSSLGDHLNLLRNEPLDSIVALTRSLFRSLAKERNTSPLFSSSCALLPKNTRVYPESLSRRHNLRPTQIPRSNVVLQRSTL